MTAREILVGLEEAGFEARTFYATKVVARHRKTGAEVTAFYRDDGWHFYATHGNTSYPFHPNSIHGLIHLLTFSYGQDARSRQQQREVG